MVLIRIIAAGWTNSCKWLVICMCVHIIYILYMYYICIIRVYIYIHVLYIYIYVYYIFIYMYYIYICIIYIYITLDLNELISKTHEISVEGYRYTGTRLLGSSSFEASRVDPRDLWLCQHVQLSISLHEAVKICRIQVTSFIHIYIYRYVYIYIYLNTYITLNIEGYNT